jgi:hypothetical protein
MVAEGLVVQQLLVLLEILAKVTAAEVLVLPLVEVQHQVKLVEQVLLASLS